ncbi:DUF4976 domain-containing protein [Acidaminobacter sp. JC074]|uniref:sulfatase-like hydrolase/transferase n=1 Tax=Acidaminobacter sp. JC074 TaxID=2530199 RepID=UPI001F115FC5|nr:sulfatase-like hydrolase/transferase [Acidaminobacter sp. JC074]MCH4890158.1 DUF4976 domain-containing protein [Acidaminobacter sp. JC074]
MTKTKAMNTLFIFSDEHCKKMLGCYGNEDIHTPNLDKLASEGVRFTNAYCNNPICMPSRASMTVGDFGSKYGYWDNMSPYGGEEKGYGHRLVDEGIKVTTIGKLHYKSDSSQTGFPDMRHPLNANGGVGDYFAAIRGFGNDAYKHAFEKNITGARWGDAPHLRFDRKTTEEAIDCIASKNEDDEPWIIQVGYITPHYPLVAPEKYKDLYPPDKLPLPKQFSLDKRPKHPVVSEMRRYMGVDYEMSEKTIRKARAVYYGMCSFLDDQVGMLLKALKLQGLDKNTRIIYATDHGEMLGEHATWFKELFYEESVSIPMIMNGPDIVPMEVQENVSLFDIYPTLLDGAGIALSDQDLKKPGRSLWPVAQGRERIEKERLAISEYHADGLSTSSYMVRDHRYKFIYHVDFPNQLFDLKNDPEELHDLGQDLNYEAVVFAMEDKLRLIIDPEETFMKSKIHQFESMRKYGGHKKILSQGVDFACTPVPEELNKAD